MAFDYPSKNRAYEAALARTKECFRADDKENGMLFLDKAISLSKELADNAAIVEFKARFTKENTQLRKIKELVEKGENPFLKKQTTGNAPANPEKKDEKEAEVTTGFFSNEVPTTTLADVAGLEAVKEQIRINVLLPLKDPELFYRYKSDAGARIVMYGPPGCGKSFVAEAIAGELKCHYAVITVPDILDKYVGEAPKRIKAIFQEAEKYDNVLLFFDEIDAMCSSRDSDDSAHTKDILTTFLTCMSGFKPKGKSLKVIIGATNRPWALDSALVRGQRLDTAIYVGLPDEKARQFFVDKEFKKHPEAYEGSDLTKEYCLAALDGFAGADIKTIFEQAATKTLRRVLDDQLPKGQFYKISKADFDAALNAHHNPVTDEMLLRYAAFEKGMMS